MSIRYYTEHFKMNYNFWKAKAAVLSGFLFELGELDRLDMEFSPQHWNAIVDHVTVHFDNRLVFFFRNGSEITLEM